MTVSEYNNSNPNIGALGSAEYQQFSDRIKGFCGRLVGNQQDYYFHYLKFVEPYRSGPYSRIIDRAIVSDDVDLTSCLNNAGLCLEASIPLGGRWENHSWQMFGHCEPERQLTSTSISMLDDIVARASTNTFSPVRPLNTEFTIQSLNQDTVRPGDLQDLAKVFSQAFDFYITPVTNPDYLEEWINDPTVLPVVVRNEKGKIISVGSGEMGIIHLETGGTVKEFKFFEIGDLASDPSYRGNGFNRIITHKLTSEAKNRGFDCIHAESRASWDVVNTIFAKNGMTYRGRLPLNTVIRGPETTIERYPDSEKNYGSLNVWSLTPADPVWEKY